MKKRILLLVAVMLLSVAGVFAQGGTTGPLTWNINDGTLLISGEGAMPDYDDMYKLAPWMGFYDMITAVIIESGVTSIGNYAFFMCINATSITIPGTIASIGTDVFYSCNSLIFINVDSENAYYSSDDGVLFNKNKTSLICYPGGKTGSYVIPNGVTTIEYQAFSNCNNLTAIIIPGSVTNIEYAAFSGCSALPSITISGGVTTIGEYAFFGCKKLTSISVDNENTHYSSDNGVLFNKNKTVLIGCPEGKSGDYVIPNGVISIEDRAFIYCVHLTSITIPNSVTSIGEWGFHYCSGLTSITIPNSVRNIKKRAFSFCSSLNSLTLSNGITRIEEGTFYECRSLTSITIPNGVTAIEEDAFAECRELTSVIIPSSVTSIGSWAFTFCFNLTSVTNLNLTPIAINSDVFSVWNIKNCTLKVATSAYSDYRVAEVWREFFFAGGGGFLVNPVASNAEYGYTTGNELYKASTTATVTATAHSGYKFVNWTKDGIEISTDNSYSFTVTEDIELVANFEEDETGIDTVETSVAKIYPNPTDGILYVETDNYASLRYIDVFDLMGRNVLTVHPPFRGGLGGLDISHLPAGMYFVRVTTETGAVVRKVVKQIF